MLKKSNQFLKCLISLENNTMYILFLQLFKIKLHIYIFHFICLNIVMKYFLRYLALIPLLGLVECMLISAIKDTHSDMFVIDDFTRGKLSHFAISTIFLLKNLFKRKYLIFSMVR